MHLFSKRKQTQRIQQSQRISLFSFNGKRIQKNPDVEKVRHFIRRTFRRHFPSFVAGILLLTLAASATGFMFPDKVAIPTAQEAVHIIAESFRSAGAPEDHLGIKTCQTIWHTLEDAKNPEESEANEPVDTEETPIMAVQSTMIQSAGAPLLWTPAPAMLRQTGSSEPLVQLLAVRTDDPFRYRSIHTITLYDRQNDEFHVVRFGADLPSLLPEEDYAAYADTPFPDEVEPLYHTSAQNQVHYAAEVARWMLANNDEDVDEQALSSIVNVASDYWFEEEDAYQLHERLFSGILTDVYNEETEADAVRLAKITFSEARGVENIVELACIMWTTLNRVDDPGYPNSVQGIIDSGHVYYYSGASTVSDNGVDLLALARDVIYRWQLEKEGVSDVGRVIPSDYFWWHGKNGHNWFRNGYYNSWYWDYSLENPYVASQEALS